jgi:ElaB/YqjD/DUF883 family membrane-anchored ribosome-binding protein
MDMNRNNESMGKPQEGNGNKNKNFDDLKEGANKIQEKAKDKIQTSMNDVKEAGKDMQANMLGYIKAHPLQSVGMAVVAGYLVALLSNR